MPPMGGMMKLPIKRYVCESGKEGCVREAQEGVLAIEINRF